MGKEDNSQVVNNTYSDNATTSQMDTILGSNIAGDQNSSDSTKDVKKCYVLMNVFAISLGFMQFGIGMNSWSNTQPAFKVYFGWTDSQETTNGDILQSIIILGAAVGALSCAKFLAIGKYRLLLILNIVLCIGVGITLVGKYVWLMCIGRFIWGLSFGAFSVVSAKMVNEIVPVELGGSYGAMNQMSLCFGAALPGTMALAYPINFNGLTKDDFYVDQYFRYIWMLPLVVSALQVLLLLTCFRNETPVYLKEKGRDEELLAVMKKYYSGMEVRKRLDAMGGDENEGNQEAQEVTIKETFFDPNIRQAAWVGFMLVLIQQMTGINSILFYSGQLFGSDTGEGLSSAQASCLINWANFVAAGGGAILLGFFGRKTLFVSSQIFCIIGMFGMWIFQEIAPNETMTYILVIAFIFGFEFGPGPIVWLYLSETCNDKATSVNTVMNWFWTLVISFITPVMNDKLEGWTWFIFAITCTLGLIYVVIFMKETRGLTKEQQKRLYRKDAQQTYEPLR